MKISQQTLSLILIEEAGLKVSRNLLVIKFVLDVGGSGKSKSDRKGGRMLMMKNRLITN